jgi:hypothetical protein
VIEIPVTYVNARGRMSGRVQLDEGGIAMLFGPKRSGGFAWGQIQRIAFDEPGRTKASIGAIAVFGVVGLAARNAFTLFTLSTSDQDMYFELQGPVGAWRATADRLIRDVAPTTGKVFVDGVVAGELPAVSGSEDIFEQIRKLGELRDSGLITSDQTELVGLVRRSTASSRRVAREHSADVDGN